MNDLSCAEVRELGAELALGVLPGDERAAALTHLEHCCECQVMVEELSDVADALLMLVPEADPSPGFARRVTAGLQTQRPHRRHRITAAMAAVVVVLGGGTALVAGLSDHGRRSTPAPFALHAPGVRIARLVAASGESVGGQVFAYAGTPSWVFMTVKDTESADSYTCELELSDGTKLPIGQFQLHDGVGNWGQTMGVDMSQIRAVHLTKATGETAATASFV